MFNEFVDPPFSVTDETNRFTPQHSNLAYVHESKRQTCKTNCFADDATVVTKLTYQSLNALKNILYNFATFSGLKCNLEKTFLIPIGAMVPIQDDIKNVGFSVVDSVCLLGVNVSRDPMLLANNFVGILEKIKRQISFWERFNLSLAGRIRISKSLLVSQVNYLGAICTPDNLTLSQMQSVLDKFCLGSTRIAKERLYSHPGAGGVGLIELKSFLQSQQATWVIKAKNAIRDNWQFDMFIASHKNILNISTKDVDIALHPVLFQIIDSYARVKLCHDSIASNFRLAYVFNNPLFKRGPRDPRLLDYDFFSSLCLNPSFCVISCITFTDLFVGNRFKTIGQLEVTFNSVLSHDHYILLRNALNYFKTAHRLSLRLTVTPVAMSSFCKIKKPGKKFRALLGVTNVKKKAENLQNVKTFRNLVEFNWPEDFCFKGLLGAWNTNFLPCRFATFLFKFVNNTLGLNTRVSHFDGTVDGKCTICRYSNIVDPEDESFIHVFFLCPVTSRWRSSFEVKLLGDLPPRDTVASRKQLWFTGTSVATSPYGFLSNYVSCTSNS
jgi:hypothetical protein